MNTASAHRCSRPGMALLVVVVLTMLIALGAYRFSFYMESQYRLTRVNEEQVHARLAALSGLELAAFLAELPTSERANAGGTFDNPGLLKSVTVDASMEATNSASGSASAAVSAGASTVHAAGTGQSSSQWRFSLVSPSASNLANNAMDANAVVGNENGSLANLRFGFENESAKLHMPTLLEWDRKFPGHARQALLALPGATEPLVDAWLRGLGVSKPRNRTGAGSSLLDRLQSNSTTDRQSEIDALKSLWLGGDLNQNYRLDPMETRLTLQPLSGRPKIGATRYDSQTTETNRPMAWQRYVTWHNGQRNETRSGQPRINLNEANLLSLHQKLIAVWPVDWANFVIAFRQYGPTSVQKNPASQELAASSESPNPDFTKPSSFVLKSPLDLVGVTVQIPLITPPSSPDGKINAPTTRKQTIRNPFSSDLSEIRNNLGKLFDNATTDANPFVIGRVDVSEAPVEVLSGIPGIDASLAQNIVQQRSSTSGTAQEPRDTIAWLLDGGSLDMATLKKIEPYITSRNDVYSVQSVGYRDQRSPVYRCTVTIDARRIPAQVRHFQIWHPWDRGFTLDQLNSPSP